MKTDFSISSLNQAAEDEKFQGKNNSMTHFLNLLRKNTLILD